MSEQRTWKRIRDRLELKLPVRVHCRETPDFEWMEITRLVNVTPFGAGFTLKRPTEKGRLLHMTIPMPRQLRVFDHVEDQYRVWALVRYVRSISNDPKQPLFEVGVAFIGKKAPASHEQDPSKRYEISQAQAQSAVVTTEMVAPITTSDQRAYTRHSIAVDLVLELLDEKNFLAQNEHTVTENLSKKGATIFTTLEVPIGRFIRLKCDQYQISLFAVVRSKSTGADGVRRIHVEFVDRLWPL
jgi:hypothetical protein